jgi:hypothetical protein
MGHATSLPADAIRFASRQALVINRVKGTNDNFLVNAYTVGVAVAESSNEYIINAEALTVQITIAGVGVAVGDDVGPEVVGDAVGPGVETEVGVSVGPDVLLYMDLYMYMHPHLQNKPRDGAWHTKTKHST